MIKKISSILLTPVFLTFCMGGFAVPIAVSQFGVSNAKINDFDLVIDASRVSEIQDEAVALGKKPSVKHIVTFLDAEGDVDFTIEVDHGKTIGYIPDSDWEEGILDYWSHSITSERLREKTPILEDVTYVPNYIYIEWLIINALDDVGLSLDDVDASNFSVILEYIKSAQNS